MHSLYDACLAAGGPGRLSGRGDLTMLVAQLSNIARSAANAGWPPRPTRNGNADSVNKFLDEPVNLETVDRILSAVNG